MCKEMSSFLGFAGYYRGFIPKYSALTNRMNSMKKAEKFEWSEDMEKDFLELSLSSRQGGYNLIRISTQQNHSY